MSHDQQLECTLVNGPRFNWQNGIIAKGKHPAHLPTSAQCDECHNANNWFGINFNHLSVTYRADHRSNVQYLDSLSTSNQIPTWIAQINQPDCADCRANGFKSRPHKNTESPDVSHGVGELRHCLGSCHTYKDRLLSMIEGHHGGKHQTADGGF